MGDPIKKAKRILKSNIYQNRVKKGKSTPRADRVFDKADAAAKDRGTYSVMRKGGATKKFKVHKMYKGTKVATAKTMKEHLALKKKGYTHTKPKSKKKK